MVHESSSTQLRDPYSIPAKSPVEPPTAIVQFLSLVVTVLLLALPAFAQTAIPPMPENASARSYGEGWECNVGFRLNGNACVAVIVPQNAYDTNRSYGPGWACLHGFRETDEDECVAVEVPEGGFLEPSGERWRCLRGFIKVDDTCREIVIPANAYLANTSTSVGWICERGFEAMGDQCSAIAVPANAYLNGSRYGQPWECERGFFEQTGLCEAIAVPENAYLNDATYGTGWTCERGYAATGGDCEFIIVPEFAHLDRSGNRWECNRNFQRSNDICVLRN